MNGLNFAQCSIKICSTSPEKIRDADLTSASA
jgi:hypothetical protein